MKGNVYVNGKYIHDYFKEKGLNASGVSREMGFSNQYIRNAINRNTMDALAVRYMCKITGMNYETVTAKPEAIKKEKPEAASLEAAEIVVEYIKDLGKILSDIVREVREERTQTVEQLNGIKKELHELSIHLKNEHVEMTQKTRAMNNAVQQIRNTAQALLDVTRAKK